MRILITWGSKRGGTEGIARLIGEVLEEKGFTVELLPPGQAARARGFDAAIVGGALYANRWHASARRFVNRREQDLRRVPVWFFSSGPLDDSAQQSDIPPVKQVSVLMERVGAQGHMTFGGRLARDARGFPASAMARTHAGDWRQPERIRAWAHGVAAELPVARPGIVVAQPGRSAARLLLHGLAGWGLSAALMVLLLKMGLTAALWLHAMLAPLVFVGVAHHYFGARGAHDPLPAALSFTGIVCAGFRVRSFPRECVRRHRRHRVARHSDLPGNLDDGHLDVHDAVRAHLATADVGALSAVRPTAGTQRTGPTGTTSWNFRRSRIMLPSGVSVITSASREPHATESANQV
jgi:menaquinone-dependent protoporphyrinogen oxidase